MRICFTTSEHPRCPGHTTRALRRLCHPLTASLPSKRKGWAGVCCFGLQRVGICMCLGTAKPKGAVLKQDTRKVCQALGFGAGAGLGRNPPQSAPCVMTRAAATDCRGWSDRRRKEDLAMKTPKKLNTHIQPLFSRSVFLSQASPGCLDPHCHTQVCAPVAQPPPQPELTKLRFLSPTGTW